MNWIFDHLWFIPAAPLLAAGMSAVAKRSRRRFAAAAAISSMVVAFVFSCAALAGIVQLTQHGEAARLVHSFPWLQLSGSVWVELGWVLDPLTAVMLVMVSLVALLVFIFSLGYMAHDDNFTRFFCFLSLFAAAMLGLILADSLLLLFVCWELVGLTSYLLIGFWYYKPAAAAAAKKAFITTRIGDLALLLGMVWLYSSAGSLLFYDEGRGCLESSALRTLAALPTPVGMAASTAIALLIFCGAVGKSGQVPLHVWLPDAMEGPTPVSALIHAATMVAAGVFLVARIYPLMAVSPETPVSSQADRSHPAFSLTQNSAQAILRPARVAPAEENRLRTDASSPLQAGPPSAALRVVTWVGAITALFAALIAVAQTDLKRILAYSTVSQLGFMMLGLGAGGVAVGMIHLICHAFFKALLFLGAGSVIHGCHEQQDIRCLGGLRRFMPLTFAAFAVGMLALSGFPLFFSGFWSKDAILFAAFHWTPSLWPFYLGLFGAFLTAFYMTRLVGYVFLGNCRLAETDSNDPNSGARPAVSHSHPRTPHESPLVMTLPLVVLAVPAILIGFLATPAWPWFQTFLGGSASEKGALGLMVLSSAIVLLGLGVGYWLYGAKRPGGPEVPDVLERFQPDLFSLLRSKFFVDEIYQGTVIAFIGWSSRACVWLDEWVWQGVVDLISLSFVAVSWVSRFFDQSLVNPGFDEGCARLTQAAGFLSRMQCGRVQRYLRMLGLAFALLVLFSIWGCRAV